MAEEVVMAFPLPNADTAIFRVGVSLLYLQLTISDSRHTPLKLIIVLSYSHPPVIMTPFVRTKLAPSPACPSITAITTAGHWDHPIHKAALHNNLEAVESLLTLNPALLETPGFNGILPVQCAARRGHLELLRYVWLA